jgi:sulfur-oxidizing protein SoxB
MVDACKLLGVDVMAGTLGIHPGRQACAGDRREGLQGKNRFRRPEHQDQRLRRQGVRALQPARDERRQGGGDRPGLPLYADRQSALDDARNGPSASRTTTCRRRSTKPAPKAPRSSSCSRTTAWTSTSRWPARVTGIDAILGGHTHDGVPQPSGRQANAGNGKTLVTNAGSNGKFLGVLDFDVKERQDFGLPLQAAAGVLQPAAGGRRHEPR